MAETNHNNKKNVSLGKPKKTGCLYYAPAGTALPADATTALPAAYTCVGYLSEDGVTNATDTDTTDINEMGGIKVLSEISGYGETWQFNMIETNEASLKLRFGTANVTGTADKLTVYHAIPSGESLVLVFEIAMTGNRVKRIVVADGTITEFDDTTYSAGPAIFNDLDMVEYLYDLQTAQTGDGSGAFAIVPFLKKLCGDQYTAMKDALRDPDTGRVSIDKVSDFIAQLLEQVAPNS